MGACLKAAEMGIQVQNPGQCINGLERCTHLTIANNVCNHNDLSSSITGFELNDRLNRDIVVPETAADSADHAWCIFCLETHIIALTRLLRVR